MAKRERSRTTNLSAAETKIESFAEDLGRMLGHARTKAESWMGQRQAIVKSLTDLRDEASKLLKQLGHRVSEVPFPRALGGSGKRGPGRPKGGPKKKRTMSAKARKAISDAQKKRWAAQRAGEKKE